MISACLLGFPCRYDGGHSQNSSLLDCVSCFCFMPFCPEQMGGLATPRPPALITGGDGYDVLKGEARLVNESGQDVTDAFLMGARASYKLARLSCSGLAVMKSRSPSCGIKTPYCEKPAGYGAGVTAALFITQGIQVFDLDTGDLFPKEHIFSYPLFKSS